MYIYIYVYLREYIQLFPCDLLNGRFLDEKIHLLLFVLYYFVLKIGFGLKSIDYFFFCTL